MKKLLSILALTSLFFGCGDLNKHAENIQKVADRLEQTKQHLPKTEVEIMNDSKNLDELYAQRLEERYGRESAWLYRDDVTGITDEKITEKAILPMRVYNINGSKYYVCEYFSFLFVEDIVNGCNLPAVEALRLYIARRHVLERIIEAYGEKVGRTNSLITPDITYGEILTTDRNRKDLPNLSVLLSPCPYVNPQSYPITYRLECRKEPVINILRDIVAQ